MGFQPLIMRSDKKFNDMVHIVDPQIPETPNLSIREFSQHINEAVEILEQLNIKHIHIHHMPHLTGRAQRPPLPVQEIATRLGLQYDLTVHDYTPICPRINLIDESGAYCGEPDVKVCETCVSTSGSPFGNVSVKSWRQTYEAIAGNARRIFVPSIDVSERLKKYYPAAKFVVRPHPQQLVDRMPAPQVARPSLCPMRVAVLGAIGLHKGSQVLLDCAADAHERGLPLEFVLFGYASNEVELRQLPNITITGPYNDGAIYDLLEEYRCHISFFPAVWPETFSYTLSIAMKANLYPVAFDFGAISERLKAMKWGELLPLELIGQANILNDRLLSLTRTPLTELLPNNSRAELYPDFLADYYELERLSGDKLATRTIALGPPPSSISELASTTMINQPG
jgi:glycosyltransferase involved in cell wall biosynthesis